MHDEAPPLRRRCEGCALPPAECLCAAIPRLAVATRVVIWMHRQEALKSSNTGRLAARMLEGARVSVFGRRDDAPSWRRALVLFPLANAPLLTPELARQHAGGEAPTLVVPDGTWSQARHLMQRVAAEPDAVVARLPEEASRYPLRRRAREGAGSTFEAIAGALAILEGRHIHAQMMPIFDAFVARTQKVRGRRSAGVTAS
jgi:DTW domain-containing protein YfiP